VLRLPEEVEALAVREEGTAGQEGAAEPRRREEEVAARPAAALRLQPRNRQQTGRAARTERAT
jgi:hypothetical protein